MVVFIFRVKVHAYVISHVGTAAVNPEVADPRDLSRGAYVTAAILFYKMADFLPLFCKKGAKKPPAAARALRARAGGSAPPPAHARAPPPGGGLRPPAPPPNDRH